MTTGRKVPAGREYSASGEFPSDKDYETHYPKICQDRCCCCFSWIVATRAGTAEWQCVERRDALADRSEAWRSHPGDAVRQGRGRLSRQQQHSGGFISDPNEAHVERRAVERGPGGLPQTTNGKARILGEARIGIHGGVRYCDSVQSRCRRQTRNQFSDRQTALSGLR